VDIPPRETWPNVINGLASSSVSFFIFGMLTTFLVAFGVSFHTKTLWFPPFWAPGTVMIVIIIIFLVWGCYARDNKAPSKYENKVLKIRNGTARGVVIDHE